VSSWKGNLLLLGNSGTGKTHIALALGLAACQNGHRVRFTTAAALVSELIEARDEKHLLRFQKQLAVYELLIVDESIQFFQAFAIYERMGTDRRRLLWKVTGGGRGIRTPDTLSSITVFKTAGFNRSPIPPQLERALFVSL
jgi:hypothetical protein